ncbi:MAG: 2,5-diamino-6-(ribosylamino)-4(3H)-pyrimidinone 5'-phosphate reductase [Candidatus Methanomethylophilus sp.]|nr:2,5-diamino-6-(ribosylamino)-4(3H)-pyrimidinone 5'-phosphate reductase [Methanomethylophilus sp.]
MKPFVRVNCAMSADGKLAGEERKQIRISSDEDIKRVKELRKNHRAILVGVGTVIADDPHLTIKNAEYKDNPTRVILDSNGRTPDSARVLDGRARTIIATNEGCTREWANAETIRCGKEHVDLARLMETLAERYDIDSIIVEGGGEVIASFFREKLVDEYNVFVGGLIIGGRNAPTPSDGNGWVADGGVRLELVSAEVLGNGALLTFRPVY